MKKADNAFLSEIDRKANEMKEKILGSKDDITYSGRAHYVAEKGDVVLLSPAAASFDSFRNFEKRGDFFCDIVRNL